MSKKKYAIYGMYSFDTTCDDSPRGSDGPSESILVKLTHDEAMTMGEWFKNENPELMDYDSCMDYIDRVRKKIVHEDNYSEEDSWQFQVLWSEDLKYDCEEYYSEHRERHYIIDGYYDFGVSADGPRPSACGGSGIYLRFEHNEVMEMGEYFNDENPSEVDFDYNFGIKEMLDEALADRMASRYEKEWNEEQDILEQEWKEEHGEDSDEEFEREEEPDFYEMAYERMGDMYHTWDEQFKKDCIAYYLAHKDD